MTVLAHEPFLKDADCTLFCGDALEVLRGLPAESVHMACTSPPFFGLRDYGTGRWEGGDPGCEHRQPATGGNPKQAANKGNNNAEGMPFRETCGLCGARRVDGQIGLEETPALWVARLVEVFREVRRVLRSDGTFWLEIGDSYAGSWSGNSMRPEGGKQRPGKPGFQAATLDERYPARNGLTPPGTKPKDLIGAPWLLAFALRADGWYLRSEIVWAKPNPMPESVTDRPTTAHSRVFLLTKRPTYFYDAEAIREPHSPDGRVITGRTSANGTHENHQLDEGERRERWPGTGRNRRSVWTLPTQPYSGAHFAVFPEKLVEPMILAGTSERGVCPDCGAPWERRTESGPDPDRPQAKRALELAEQHGLTEAHIAALRACGISDVGKALVTTNGAGRNDPAVIALAEEARAVLGGYAREFLIRGRTETTGWQPTCDHDRQPVPATVLDCFAGAGTTCLVARKLGRRSIGIDLSADYLELAARRLAQQSLFAETAS